MTKLTDAGKISDLVKYSKGLIFLRTGFNAAGERKTSFYSYDIDKGELLNVKKDTYLLNKFGINYHIVTEYLSDVITCDADVADNDRTCVVYPVGEIGIFSVTGRLLEYGEYFYDNAPIRDCAFYGDCIWSAVPARNAVVRYNLNLKKIDMRIGGFENTAFNGPVSISRYDEYLYVCNRNSHEVRKINAETFDVTDYRRFPSPVNKFFKFGKTEVAVLDSGIYIV